MKVGSYFVSRAALLQPTCDGFLTAIKGRLIHLDTMHVRFLSLFLSGNDAADSIRIFCAETSITSSRLIYLLELLIKYGLLEKDKELDGSGPTSHILRCELPVHSLNSTAVRIPRSAIVIPSADGFVFQGSSACFPIDIDSMELLLQFVSFATPEDVIQKLSDAMDREVLRTKIAGLVSRGALLPMEGSAPTKWPAVCHNGPVLPQETPLISRQIQRHSADGRIPVYPILVDQQGIPPLALGEIVAFAKSYKDGRLNDKYNFITEWFGSKEEIIQAYRRFGPGIFLCSMYIWSELNNIAISKVLKKTDSANLMIFGGPSAPAYEEACKRYFERHEQVDIVVRGEGEVVTAEILDILGSRSKAAEGALDLACLKEVKGLTFRNRNDRGLELTRTPDHDRMTELSIAPSPYLTGIFDNLVGRIRGALIETNRGCPYSCAFCDWGSATSQKVVQFPLERVRGELEWMARNHLVAVGCADANFGILKRDVEITGMIVDIHQRYGYPKQWTASYAKNAVGRNMKIVKMLRNANIHAEPILSIQSTNPEVLTNCRRQNIKTGSYDEMAHMLRSEDMDVCSDIMIGLPGETVESFKHTLQFLFDRGVFAQAYRIQLLPNSPMADPAYLEKYEIKVRGGKIVQSYSFNESDIKAMEEIFACFSFASNFGILKYILRYLQNEYEIRAVDAVHRIVDILKRDGTDYPRLSWLMSRHYYALKEMLTPAVFQELAAPGSWHDLFSEVRLLLAIHFGVQQGSGLETVIAVQTALLPSEGRTFPYTLDLPHDFVAYIAEQKSSIGVDKTRKHLEAYAPGRLIVTDPEKLSDGPRDYLLDHSIRFELDSELSPSRRDGRHRARDDSLYLVYRQWIQSYQTHRLPSMSM